MSAAPPDSPVAASCAVMGIVNVTPDSFSDGGAAFTPEAAVAQAKQLIAQGADIIDLGAESTRPGAAEVPAEEEWRRLAPVLEQVLAAGITVSVDTRKAEVMRRALRLGAPVINDVSALTFDPEAMDAVCDSTADVVLMHAQGLPDTMQDNPVYADVVSEVRDWLAARVTDCEAHGIARSRIVIDPGIGFGKTFQHNLMLMRAVPQLKQLGVRVLVGASRKGFIGWLTGVQQADQRLGGSVGAAIAAAAGGADIIRVHDVAETRQALTVWQACRNGFAAPGE